MTKQTERLEQEYIDQAIEAEREGGHPIGYRAVKQVLEVTPLAQERFDTNTSGMV